MSQRKVGYSISSKPHDLTTHFVFSARHVYQKWNQHLFMECYQAFKDGRAEKDPSDGWYQGEIGFFDFYM